MTQAAIAEGAAGGASIVHEFDSDFLAGLSFSSSDLNQIIADDSLLRQAVLDMDGFGENNHAESFSDPASQGNVSCDFVYQ